MTSRVGDLMSPRVVSASENAKFKEIAVVMRTNGFSALPVVDADHRVIGVVSDADLVLKVEDPEPEEGSALESYRSRIDRRKRTGSVARELMTSPAVTVRSDTEAREAAELMHRHGVKRLPVVDGEGRLEGIVSRVDLLGVFFVRDDRLRDTVLDEVARLLSGPTDVRVDVAGGVVALEGAAYRRSDVSRIGHTIRELEGVVAVDNLISYEYDDLAPSPGTS
ncbi:CBS domain-containing protein [Nocardiopsis sp. YSL2]|uniref:CBS domain-containing protein n=1 Tax=Nocardiopsis sp. YSL2 TaxID=2939492 RepID=UPI0026F45B0A|nr:CBS domain-containing protein [Nocardiopsis sp. YSL2]